MGPLRTAFKSGESQVFVRRVPSSTRLLLEIWVTLSIRSSTRRTLLTQALTIKHWRIVSDLPRDSSPRRVSFRSGT